VTACLRSASTPRGGWRSRGLSQARGRAPSAESAWLRHMLRRGPVCCCPGSLSLRIPAVAQAPLSEVRRRSREQFPGATGMLPLRRAGRRRRAHRVRHGSRCRARLHAQSGGHCKLQTGGCFARGQEEPWIQPVFNAPCTARAGVSPVGQVSSRAAPTHAHATNSSAAQKPIGSSILPAPETAKSSRDVPCA
jgi:hypothetical protein